MTAGIYIRKSRKDKDAVAARLLAQRQQLPAYARSQGWAFEVFDDGYASAAVNKVALLPERARLESGIRAGRFGVVLTIELSRLSRDHTLVDFAQWLALCAEHHVKLATPGRILDPGQPTDWVLLVVEGGFSSASMKTDTIRMAEGRAAAWEAGRYVGGQIPLGYIHDGARVVPSERAPEIREAYRLLAQGVPPRVVAERVGLDFQNTRRLQRPERIAWYASRRISRVRPGEWVACEWPALIDSDTAERVLLCREARSRRIRRTHIISPLLYGLVRCGYCGCTAPAAVTRTLPGGEPWWGYMCTWYQRGRPRCPAKRRYGPLVDTLAANEILAVAADTSAARAAWAEAAALQDPEAALAAVRARSVEVEAQRQRVVSAIAQGVISFADARQAISTLDAQRDELRREAAQVEASRLAEPPWDAIEQIPAVWPGASADGRAEFAALLISGAELWGDRLTLHFRLPLPPVSLSLPPTHQGVRYDLQGYRTVTGTP